MSFQPTPASASASPIASAAICMADLPSKRPNGCRPTPMIATSFVLRLMRSPPSLLPFRDLLGVERHGQCCRRAEGLAIDVRVVIGDELDIGHSTQQTFQRYASLHALEVQTEAGVFSGVGGDVRCRPLVG